MASVSTTTTRNAGSTVTTGSGSIVVKGGGSTTTTTTTTSPTDTTSSGTSTSTDPTTSGSSTPTTESGVSSSSDGGGSSATTVTVQELQQDPSLLSDTSSGSTVTVTDASVEEAVELLEEDSSGIDSVRIVDTSANVEESIDTLSALAQSSGKIESIELTDSDPTLTLTAAQYEVGRQLLGLVRNGSFGLRITGASVEQALGYAGNGRIRTINIHDTTGAVVAQLDELERLGLRVKRGRESVLESFGLYGDARTVQTLKHSELVGSILSGAEMTARNLLAHRQASRKEVSIDVVDRPGEILRHRAVLDQLGPQVRSVTLSGQSGTSAAPAG